MALRNLKSVDASEVDDSVGENPPEGWPYVDEDSVSFVLLS